MNQNKIFLIASCFSFLTLHASTIFSEQKINVYNVPHNQVNDLDYQKLQKYTREQPLYTVKQGVSSGKILIRSQDESVTVVIDKNKNPISNYNSILAIAKKYADENIPLVDSKRISKALNLAKLEIAYDDKKYDKDNNSELIVAVKQKHSSNANAGFDYGDLKLVDAINYFIDNYAKINKTQATDLNKDVRFQLISSIKTKIQPYTNIDASHIDYSISLEELKLLRNTLLNNMN